MEKHLEAEMIQLKNDHKGDVLNLTNDFEKTKAKILTRIQNII